jgi:SAM-dependent methyltransferase
MADDLIATTTAAYDLVAASYALRNAVAADDHVEHQRSFMRLLPGPVVADVGCGPGRDAAWFTTEGIRVVGFDRSVEMLARARAARIPVARADLRSLPVRDASLDGVWSSASLLHVPRDQVPATLLSWRRCLRAGGMLGLATSLGGTEGWEDVPYDVATQPVDAPVRRWFVHHTRDGLLALLAGAGFTVMSATERRATRHWLQVIARAG